MLLLQPSTASAPWLHWQPSRHEFRAHHLMEQFHGLHRCSSRHESGAHETTRQLHHQARWHELSCESWKKRGDTPSSADDEPSAHDILDHAHQAGRSSHVQWLRYRLASSPLPWQALKRECVLGGQKSEATPLAVTAITDARGIVT